ncbi:MAG: pilin [Minisyncoccia bacterium]
MEKIGDLLTGIQQLLNTIIPILILVGVVYFVWGVVKFMIADGEEAKTKGKDQIIYGLIGFTVIIGLWGLVNIVVNSLGFGAGQLNAPTVTNLGVQATGSACRMGENFQGVLGYFTCIINDSVIPFMFAIAIAMFIWGAVKFFIINADEEAKREQGKQFMIWGIIALAVMMSVWGLVGILTSTFGESGSVLPQVTPPK